MIYYSTVEWKRCLLDQLFRSVGWRTDNHASKAKLESTEVFENKLLLFISYHKERLLKSLHISSRNIILLDHGTSTSMVGRIRGKNAEGFRNVVNLKL